MSTQTHTLIFALLPVLGSALPAHAGTCELSIGSMSFGTLTTVHGRSGSTPTASSDSRITLSCTQIARGGPYRIILTPPGDAGSPVQRLTPVSGGAPMGVVLQLAGGEAGMLEITGHLPPGHSRHEHVVIGRVPAGQSHLRAGAYRAAWSVRLEYTP